MISPPYTSLIETEQMHLFMCYCTFIMNIQGKKMSVQNVFVYTLQNEKMKTLLKDILSIDTEGYELEVMKGLDTDKIYCNYIVLENLLNDANYDKYMESIGYEKIQHNHYDSIYRKIKEQIHNKV